MDIYELINQRQSDRKYDQDKRIDRTVIERIISAAREAPSACNAQPWHFVVVDEPDLCKEVASSLTSKLTAGMNKFAASAPVIIVVVEESVNLSSRIGGLIKKRHFPDLDIGIACEHICLAATQEGLGSCMIGWFEEEGLKSLLQIPSNRRIRMVITLGYSLEKKKAKKRKPIEKILSFNKY